MKTYKLLVIGGCHVTAYGIKDSKGFVEYLSESLEAEGIRLEKKVIPLFRLDQANLLEGITNDFQPDVIIFQMGHYEFTINFFKEVKRLIGRKRPKRGLRTSGDLPLITDTPETISNSAYLISRLASIAKNIVDIIIPIRKRVYVRHEKNVLAFKTEMSKLNKEIIFLSAFPALEIYLNPLRERFNKKCGQLLSSENNITFVKTSLVIPRERKYFQDVMHLNKEGHILLGKHLHSVMKKVIDKNELNSTIASRCQESL